MTETFVVMTHKDANWNWTRMRIAHSRQEAVGMLDEARAGRPLDPKIKRRIAAFLDGEPAAAWSTGTPISHLQCMGPAMETAYGHVYRVTE